MSTLSSRIVFQWQKLEKPWIYSPAPPSKPAKSFYYLKELWSFGVLPLRSIPRASKPGGSNHLLSCQNDNGFGGLLPVVIFLAHPFHPNLYEIVGEALKYFP